MMKPVDNRLFTKIKAHSKAFVFYKPYYRRVCDKKSVNIDLL